VKDAGRRRRVRVHWEEKGKAVSSGYKLGLHYYRGKFDASIHQPVECVALLVKAKRPYATDGLQAVAGCLYHEFQDCDAAAIQLIHRLYRYILETQGNHDLALDTLEHAATYLYDRDKAIKAAEEGDDEEYKECACTQ
jgi:hypothetical protein